MAAKEAKIVEAKKIKDAEKAAAEQEKAAAKAKDKDCEDCGNTGNPTRVMKQAEVKPCFSAKKLAPSKAKEFAEQLKRQEEALNRMTVKEFQEARAFFGKNKRKGTGSAQKDARIDYEKLLTRDLREKYEKTESPLKAREMAKAEAKLKMKDIAALHEPDMIAGGKDAVTNMGDRKVNSSIGSQWRSRVSSVDDAAKKIDPVDADRTKMNVKLKNC